MANKLIVVNPDIALAGIKFFSTFIASSCYTPPAVSIAKQLGVFVLVKVNNKIQSTDWRTAGFYNNAVLAYYFFGIALKKSGLIKYLSLVNVSLNGGLSEKDIIIPKELADFKSKLYNFYVFLRTAKTADVYARGLEEFQIDESELDVVSTLTQIYHPIYIHDCYDRLFTGVYKLTKSIPATVV